MNNDEFLATPNYKDHFIYDNQPFFNPGDGDFNPIRWAIVIDSSLIPSNDLDDDVDDWFTPPEYFLQVSASGEIRGVTHNYDEHEDYYSVTATGNDVRFLKAFSSEYPNTRPTLTALMDYRKYLKAKRKEEFEKEKENLSNHD